LVEHGLITMDDFASSSSATQRGLHTALNPDFFKARWVEGAGVRSSPLIDTIRKWIDEAHVPRGAHGGRDLDGLGIRTFEAAGRLDEEPRGEKQSTLQNYVADPEVRKRAWQSRLTSPAWKAEPNDGHRAFVTLEKRGSSTR